MSAKRTADGSAPQKPQKGRVKETAAIATNAAGNLGGFKLLRGPLKEGQCAECAVEHKPEMPHNQQSLFWQYGFREKHGTWPTWRDAMEHCTPEMRSLWIEELGKRGIVV